MKKVTIIDVAKYAEVSTGTVSRVLNNKNVKPLTKTKVENAIKALDYQRNNAARNLRTNKSKAFAFIVTDITNFTFSTIAKSLSDILDEYGYSLILYNIGREDVESKLEHFFSERSVDGAFLAIGEEKNPRINKLLNNLDVPLLILDRQIECHTADFIFSDYYNGIRTATEHLISQGHKNIAFITGSLNIYPSREGIRGYTDALKLNDLPIHKSFIRSGAFTTDFGIREIEDLMPKIKSKNITAFITGGTPILVGALKTLRKHNIAINNDVSIISFEDSEVSELMSISAIKRPLHDIGTKAAYSLINRLIQNNKGIDATSSITLPTELIIRKDGETSSSSGSR